MKAVFKYLLATLVLALTAALIVLTALQADGARAHTACHHVVIENESDPGQRFLPDEDVLRELEKNFGSLYGVPLEKLDLHAMEELFDDKSAVQKSEVFVCYPDSSLHIRIREKIPFLRFQCEGNGYYCDREGRLFPLQAHYSAWVSVVDGHLPIERAKEADKMSNKEKRWLKDILSLAEYMQDDRRWKHRCTQIHVGRNGSISLAFDGWDEIFLIGDCRDLDSKFRRIEQYICTVRPASGKTYKSVNVRFDGQIICQ